jgi:2-amino-4-hydroxy-6-hydroxymethyldihydropteridine diphosphokinase
MSEPSPRPSSNGAASARAYLALGSNQGDSRVMILKAVRQLADLPGTRIVAVSGLYLTAPIGGPEQPLFMNAVAAIETQLAPIALLEELQRIESSAGRTHETPWGPRTLDLDVLWYHGFEATEGPLQVPHPRMEERRFVLEPLAEIAPDLVLPSGRTVVEALDLVRNQVVARIGEATIFDDNHLRQDPAKE